MDITLVLAIWGAILSTAAILWNIFRDVNDKGRLDVMYYIGNMIGGIESSDKDYIIFKITNVGRKPITITQVGGGFKVKHFIIPTPNVPKLLNPTEYFTVQGEDFSIFEKDLQFVGAWDSTGKIWKVKTKTLRYWIKVYKETIKKENFG